MTGKAAFPLAVALAVLAVAVAGCGGSGAGRGAETATVRGGPSKPRVVGMAPWRGYRTPNDPCGTDPAPHFEERGISCGAVFEVPGHRTWRLPDEYRGPNCAEGQFAPRSDFDWHFGYWTENGEWITWNGTVEPVWQGRTVDIFGEHKWLVNVIPWFHNWGGRPWKMRAFYYCRGH